MNKNDSKLILKQAELLYHAEAVYENTLGNSANLIFEVEIEKTPFILRASEYSEKKVKHIDFELNWVNYLSTAIDSIVKTVKSVNNRLYEVIQVNCKNYILCLFEKAKGKIVDTNNSSEFNESLFFNLGVLMGKMHKLTSEYQGNIITPEFEWYHSAFFDDQYNVILDEEVQPFEQKYISELHALPKSKDCYGIIHDDVHIHNFFVDNGHIKLFDYDDCHFSWYACDIADTLYHAVQFSGAESEEERTEFAEMYLLTYLKGYMQEYKISGYWIYKIDLFMRYRMTCTYKFVQNNWKDELVHPHQGYLDWHKNRILNDLPYVFIDYEKIIGSLPMIYRYEFLLAGYDDIPEIAALYHSLVGTPGCTWDEEYPNRESAESDFDRQSLYVLKKNDKIIAAASAGNFDELGHLQWKPQNPCELARIGVSPEWQNQGIGTIILQNIMRAMKEKGFDGIRMLVSKTNFAALALYEKNGFEKCGETFMFDHDFYCYEAMI